MQGYALIADPDAEAASLYAAAAGDEGLTYVSVRDGVVAMTVLGERGTPQLLVTEITLPGIPGLDLITRVRASLSGEDPAIIVVSADRTLREQAAEMRDELRIGAVLSKATPLDSIRRVLKRLGIRRAPSPPGSLVRLRG